MKKRTALVFRATGLAGSYLVAEIASRNHVRHFAVISSLGANAERSNFYLKVKGQMEAEIARNHFENVIIVRPSLLTGKKPFSNQMN